MQDDGSCWYPEENYDCYGNCIVDIDCNSECGGDAVQTSCGCDEIEYQCSDGSVACNPLDCPGGDVAGCTDTEACNYDSGATWDDGSCEYDDECGICGGENVCRPFNILTIDLNDDINVVYTLEDSIFYEYDMEDEIVDTLNYDGYKYYYLKSVTINRSDGSEDIFNVDPTCLDDDENNYDNENNLNYLTFRWASWGYAQARFHFRQENGDCRYFYSSGNLYEEGPLDDIMINGGDLMFDYWQLDYNYDNNNDNYGENYWDNDVPASMQMGLEDSDDCVIIGPDADECGICFGGNADMDCAGECKGDAFEDCVGDCEGYDISCYDTQDDLIGLYNAMGLNQYDNADCSGSPVLWYECDDTGEDFNSLEECIEECDDICELENDLPWMFAPGMQFLFNDDGSIDFRLNGQDFPEDGIIGSPTCDEDADWTTNYTIFRKILNIQYEIYTPIIIK
jgi:hypothetical protein